MTRSLCQRMVLAEMTATQLINRWYVYYLESSWLITNPNIIKSRKAHSATSLHVVEHGNCLRDKRLELIQVQTTSRTCELAANPYDLRVDRFVSLRGLSVTKCWLLSIFTWNWTLLLIHPPWSDLKEYRSKIFQSDGKCWPQEKSSPG